MDATEGHHRLRGVREEHHVEALEADHMETLEAVPEEEDDVAGDTGPREDSYRRPSEEVHWVEEDGMAADRRATGAPAGVELHSNPPQHQHGTEEEGQACCTGRVKDEADGSPVQAGGQYCIPAVVGREVVDSLVQAGVARTDRDTDALWTVSSCAFEVSIKR